jgi:hypothetical protein
MESRALARQPQKLRVKAAAAEEHLVQSGFDVPVFQALIAGLE